MRRRALFIAAFIVIALFLAGRAWRSGHPSTAGGSSPASSGSDKIAWRSVADAPRLAAEAKKPILYDFNAAWCGPCHELSREVFSDDEASRYINETFIPVSVVDRQEEDGHNSSDIDTLQRRYEIDGFPTLVIADADGKPTGKAVGYGGKYRTIEFLKQAR